MNLRFDGDFKSPQSAIVQAQSIEELEATLAKVAPLKIGGEEFGFEKMKVLFIEEPQRFSREMPMGPHLEFDFDNIPEEFNLRQTVRELISKKKTLKL